MAHSHKVLGLALGGVAALALGGCASTSPGLAQWGRAPMGQPGVPFSGVKPAPENQAVLDSIQVLGYRPIETLDPVAARQQPTAADGVKDVLRRQGRPITPPAGVTTRDLTYPAGVGSQPVRVYMPAEAATGPRPVIVYYHGGGFVIADIDTYDASPRALVRETGAIVVSVEYRHAPEAKFPAQHDDAFAAYQWALANAASWGGDPTKVAVAGESAGGNLAAAVSMMARDRGVQAPVHQLIVYPIAGIDMNTESYRENANAKPLNRAAMMWFAHHLVANPADLADPRINLVGANLRDLPPATIVMAQIDPLRSDGEMLATKLREAGVPVDSRMFPGTTHEFFGMDAVLPQAVSAQRYAGERLRDAFKR